VGARTEARLAHRPASSPARNNFVAPDPEPYAPPQKAHNLEPLPQTVAPPALPPQPVLAIEEDEVIERGPGYRAGAFVLRPSLSEEIGWDSNPRHLPDGQARSSAVVRTQASLSARSDWSSSSLKIDLRGSYSAFSDNQESSRRSGSARAALHVDVTSDTAYNVEAHTGLSTLRAGTPESNGSVVGTNVLKYGGSVGGTRRFGKFALSLTGLANHTYYEDGVNANGDIVALSNSDVTTYGLKSRATYHSTPFFNPFIEASVSANRRDLQLDSSGYNRDSNGYYARLGDGFRLSDTLRGEVAAGYVHRQYVDGRLVPISGISATGILRWQATPLTKITMRGSAERGETTTTGASSVLTRKAQIDVSHALTHDVKITGSARYVTTSYDGITLNQDQWRGRLGAEYSLSRSVLLRGSYAYSVLRSSTPTSNYSASTFLVGVKLTP
jgi:hypothetical protein